MSAQKKDQDLPFLYDSFTEKMAVIYALEPRERYFGELVAGVPFQDTMVAMDMILEQMDITVTPSAAKNGHK